VCATYVDNTPLFANFLLHDIQRVEVMRGPQGTLYGSSALGGTIRYIMNRPDVNEFDASVGVTYGQTEHSDGDNVAIDGMVNIPLSDTAAFRLSAGSVENEGVVDYVNLYQLQDGKPVVLSDSGECLSVNDSSLTNEELAFNVSSSIISGKRTKWVRAALSRREPTITATHTTNRTRAARQCLSRPSVTRSS
jgi:outer membrane receptor protein involved in Fe transport